MKLKTINISLTLLSTLLMFFAWPPFKANLILLIGLVPLLLVHHHLRVSKKRHLKFWLFALLFQFIFNLLTTWWVKNASFGGSVAMIISNSLLLSLPFWLFSITESKLPKTKYFSLIVYYLSIEYFHFNWGANWPWLTLGKGFASSTWYIQWYEITGEMGGSLLILLTNIYLTNFLIFKQKKHIVQPLILNLACFLISISLYFIQPKSNIPRQECVISQPNIDPYLEKFYGTPNYIYPDSQMAITLNLCKGLINSNTQLLLFPETAIVGWNEIKSLNNLSVNREVLNFTKENNISILSGAETFETYLQKKKNLGKPTTTARLDEESNTYWDSYNTALNFQKGETKDIYHKSKLVPGVEVMPFAFLEKLSIDLNGTTGSLGISKEPKNFKINDNFIIAPLICYESIFGDYVTEFVKKGANSLAVITNDAWWGETPGYKQHLLFGAIRCIETRREMIRSANTGISAKIDMFGKITHKTKYNERISFKCSIKPQTKMTIYVKTGNIIGKISSALSFVLILFMLTLYIRQKFT